MDEYIGRESIYKTLSISEWFEILGIGKTTIRTRLESGWPDEDALTIPVRKRTRGYRPSASCVAKMEGGDNDANKKID